MNNEGLDQKIDDLKPLEVLHSTYRDPNRVTAVDPDGYIRKRMGERSAKWISIADILCSEDCGKTKESKVDNYNKMGGLNGEYFSTPEVLGSEADEIKMEQVEGENIFDSFIETGDKSVPALLGKATRELHREYQSALRDLTDGNILINEDRIYFVDLEHGTKDAGVFDKWLDRSGARRTCMRRTDYSSSDTMSFYSTFLQNYHDFGII